MEIMEGVRIHLLLLLVTLIQGIQGQVITPSSVAVAVGDDVSLECTTTATSGFTFSWVDASTGTVIYIGETKQSAPEEYVNFNVTEDIPAKSSTLIINSILRQDAGDYSCTVTAQAAQDPATVTVEVGSVSEPMALTISGDGSSFTYEATCEAIGSSPEETITWILGGVTQTDGIVDTDPGTSDDSLFDKRSVFTFPSTTDNYNVQLECNISGHQATELNRQETILVDIHNPPVLTGGIVIGFTRNGAGLTVTCDINNTVAPAVPAMSTFYIYSNGTLVTKPESDNTVTVPQPEQDIEVTCIGGNYLGNTTTSITYDPDGTTAPPPTTALEKTTKSGDETVSGPGTVNDGANVAAIAGGVVGAIVVIVIIVIAVCYCKKEERFCFEAGGTKSSGSSKPAGSAVGSSNGSEREKTKPEAAPRGHGSIQHTNDNPNQDMYAMVDKKPSGGRGGDAPDRGSGPGQNEPQGMLYADLDLSHKAGHTDKHVPKNENDVVVYSSILV